jgi:hypothetical protein
VAASCSAVAEGGCEQDRSGFSISSQRSEATLWCQMTPELQLRFDVTILAAMEFDSWGVSRSSP